MKNKIEFQIEFYNDYLEALKIQKKYTDLKTETIIEEVLLNNKSFYVVKNNYGKVLKQIN